MTYFRASSKLMSSREQICLSPHYTDGTMPVAHRTLLHSFDATSSYAADANSGPSLVVVYT